MGDEYEWSGVLDCGCAVGPLWDHGGPAPIKVTYWWECPRHSARRGYNEHSGGVLYARDRRVRTVSVKAVAS